MSDILSPIITDSFVIKQKMNLLLKNSSLPLLLEQVHFGFVNEPRTVRKNLDFPEKIGILDFWHNYNKPLCVIARIIGPFSAVFVSFCWNSQSLFGPKGVWTTLDSIG